VGISGNCQGLFVQVVGKINGGAHALA
jgi:hypothetical protein